MKTIVMTGGTSGLGRVAADRMQAQANVRLIIGARSEGHSLFETLPLDLARLSSVDAFVEAIGQTLGNTEINGLVLNAGSHFGNIDQRTEDGFEPNFAVNHLAHFLLLRRLAPRLAEDAIVVITTSDTHDPSINPIAPPKHADVRRAAFPVQDSGKRSRPFIDGFRAYSTSKLFNLLTARGFANSSDTQARNIRTIAYNPGFTPGTDLGRHAPVAVRALAGIVVPILRPFLRINTVDLAGRTLADLALGEIEPPSERVYASLVLQKLKWPEPSELARENVVMERVWRESSALLSERQLLHDLSSSGNSV